MFEIANTERIPQDKWDRFKEWINIECRVKYGFTSTDKLLIELFREFEKVDNEDNKPESNS